MDMKTTIDFVGYYKFVRLSSLDENEVRSIGFDKQEIIKRLHLSEGARTMITLPVYEEELIHERFEFVSYLELPTVHIDLRSDTYEIMSVPEFLEISGCGREAVEELRKEWRF